MKVSTLRSIVDSTEKHTFTYEGKKLPHVILDAPITDEDTVLYVAGYEFGSPWLIAVTAHGSDDGFEAAWEAWIDALPTIPESELVEAYGPEGTPDGSFLDMAHDKARGVSGANESQYGSSAWAAHIAAIHADAEAMFAAYTKENQDEYPDLVEGYQQQSNSTGTGVVSLGHYVGFHKADLDLLEVSEEVSK